MDQDTPARLISRKDLRANCRAAEICLNSIPPEAVVKTILDVRYGTGRWAKAALTRFPGAQVLGFEHDEKTVEDAWKPEEPGKLTLHGRFAPVRLGCRTWDLVLADFNTLTSLKRQLLDELLAGVTTNWLIFTDVACGKLHLNYASYGLRAFEGGEGSLLIDYWDAFRIEGYKLRGFAQEHSLASTALYERETPGGTGGNGDSGL